MVLCKLMAACRRNANRPTIITLQKTQMNGRPQHKTRLTKHNIGELLAKALRSTK